MAQCLLIQTNLDSPPERTYIRTMIIITMTTESLGDIAFVKSPLATKCTTGLDANYPIIGVMLNGDGTITFTLDDGKETVTDQRLEFSATPPV